MTIIQVLKYAEVRVILNKHSWLLTNKIGRPLCVLRQDDNSINSLYCAIWSVPSSTGYNRPRNRQASAKES